METLHNSRLRISDLLLRMLPDPHFSSVYQLMWNGEHGSLNMVTEGAYAGAHLWHINTSCKYRPICPKSASVFLRNSSSFQDWDSLKDAFHILPQSMIIIILLYCENHCKHWPSVLNLAVQYIYCTTQGTWEHLLTASPVWRPRLFIAYEWFSGFPRSKTDIWDQQQIKAMLLHTHMNYSFHWETALPNQAPSLSEIVIDLTICINFLKI